MVSIPLAIMNIYSKNALYVFLFICALIGVAMNSYSYYDFFKNKKIKDTLFLISVGSNVLGLGVGIGLLAIFYNISNKPENLPSLGSFIWIGALITIIVCASTIGLIYFIPKKINKK